MKFYIFLGVILVTVGSSWADTLHDKISARMADYMSLDQFEIVSLEVDECDVLDSYVVGGSGGYSFISSSQMDVEISSINDVSILKGGGLIVKRVLNKKFSESISNIAKYYEYSLEFNEEEFYKSVVDNYIASVFDVNNHDLGVFYGLYWLETMVSDRDFLPVHGYYIDGRVVVLYSHNDRVIFIHVYDSKNDVALEMKYEFLKGKPSCGEVRGIVRMYNNIYGSK